MLNSLFDRVTDLQLVPDDDTKIVGMPFRSPKHLPVTFRPRRLSRQDEAAHEKPRRDPARRGRPWSVEDFELDPPKAGEVLVEMAAAGLCHSDDHILKGDMSVSNEVAREYGLIPMFPMIGGHEGAGTVA